MRRYCVIESEKKNVQSLIACATLWLLVRFETSCAASAPLRMTFQSGGEPIWKTDYGSERLKNILIVLATCDPAT